MDRASNTNVQVFYGVSVTVTGVLNSTTNSSVDRTNDDATGISWLPTYWSSFIEHPDDQQNTAAGVWLRLVVLPVILLAGFLGNALTLALMWRPSMRRHSYSPYLTALAVSDSMALLVRLAFWINLVALTLERPVIISFRSEGACAIVEYVCTANHVLCSWLVVCLTYERLVVIVFPLRSARLVKASNSAKVVIAVVFSSSTLMTYVPVVVHWIPKSGGCVIRYPLELYAHFALATTFVSILPLLLICCGNIVIVLVLLRETRKRAKLLIGSTAPAAKSKTLLAKTPDDDIRVYEGHHNNGVSAAPASVHHKHTAVIECNHENSDSNKAETAVIDQGSRDNNNSLVTPAHRTNLLSFKSVQSASSIERTYGELNLTVRSQDLTNAAKPCLASNTKPKRVPNLSKHSEPNESSDTSQPTATKPEARSSTGDQQVRRVTLTLLCVSITFLLLVMPNALLVLVLGLRPEWSSLQPLLDPLASLWDMNFAINFYLYVFAGTTFRVEVLKMLRCRGAD